jgi:electron transport complex protein RnfG
MAVKSSFMNMTLCLLAICLVCSGLLAGVYALTKEPIDAAAKAKNEAAILEVLPENAATIEEERIVEYEGATYTYNLAYDEKGEVVGCAVNVAPVGFGGPVLIKVGFKVNAQTGQNIVWNTKVLSQAETPGLGAKCVEPAFASQFKELDPAAKKLYVKKDGGDIDAITASTITSRAYVSGVATAVNVLATIQGTPMLIDTASGASSAETDNE